MKLSLLCIEIVQRDGTEKSSSLRTMKSQIFTNSSVSFLIFLQREKRLLIFISSSSTTAATITSTTGHLLLLLPFG